MSTFNEQADISTEPQIETQQPKTQQSNQAGPELPPADPADGFTEVANSVQQEGANGRPEVVADPPSRESRESEDLQKLRTERDTLFDRLARLQAEFDNYRKRSARENSEFRDYALADTAKSLLPAIDNFALALKNSGANPDDFRKGVELIHKQLQEVLQKMNVQRINTQGQPFDPRLHEAIEMVESNDAEDNHVLEELQAGYRIKERLVRPAMVRVAKNTKK